MTPDPRRPRQDAKNAGECDRALERAVATKLMIEAGWREVPLLALSGHG